ncbi:hypothetical protein [Flavisolibacter ginsenosidimutans]|uniref:Uncharacterized protein n=1 Tax=Flavisolibacter ginsenosidimutans TaxID=661481 RepID=A0A5B8UNE5_9BACT|nr:hypothetical protein [Flavisolibacter ginsenosidimutans]QEC57976.1 hypothetical protein FSB75_19375 [Flavisolibacter ginsenosidimutans]
MKRNPLTLFQNKQLLSLAFPPLLMIALVVGLLVLMVATCIKFTKGPQSTSALVLQLQRLQAKFLSAETINPEKERAEMEVLQNNIKTASDPSIISGNLALQKLFSSNCQSIRMALNNSHAEDKTAWVKLNALMTDFNFLYFEK